uniref:Uncharacterized protein n=1 Tax=Anguilla anguilla TaxID=7936 RepID=A0A0E9UPF9_ANGAN
MMPLVRTLSTRPL